MTDPRGIVVWFTGLPQSGKSTLATRVAQRLAPRHACLVLDSDALRRDLQTTEYDPADRAGFYTRLATVAASSAEQGFIVLVAATANLRTYREQARARAPRFLEVWIRTPVEACEARDTKGLYAEARAGHAPELPGIGAPYEPPLAAEVVADGGFDDAAAAEIERLVVRAA
jgi:adenylylsulfate kinase